MIEYALGGNPSAPEAAPGPALEVSEPGYGGHLVLRFTPVVVTGLRYLIEASSDLSDRPDVSDITTELTPGRPFRHIDSASLAEHPRRFLRLRIELAGE